MEVATVLAASLIKPQMSSVPSGSCKSGKSSVVHVPVKPVVNEKEAVDAGLI